MKLHIQSPFSPFLVMSYVQKSHSIFSCSPIRNFRVNETLKVKFQCDLIPTLKANMISWIQICMSTRSMMTQNPSMTSREFAISSQASSQGVSKMEEQVFIQLGVYRGVTVAVKRVHKNGGVTLTRDDHIELKMVEYIINYLRVLLAIHGLEHWNNNDIISTSAAIYLCLGDFFHLGSKVSVCLLLHNLFLLALSTTKFI